VVWREAVGKTHLSGAVHEAREEHLRNTGTFSDSKRKISRYNHNAVVTVSK